MKECCRCKQFKSITEFHKLQKATDGFNYYCKTCRKQENAEFFQRTKPRHQSSRMAYKNRIRARLKTLKETTPCTACNLLWPACVMDFHHIDPTTKIDGVSTICNRGVAWQCVLAEIDKCELLCANCHRLKTYSPP